MSPPVGIDVRSRWVYKLYPSTFYVNILSLLTGRDRGYRMGEKPRRLRWGVEKRLEFIEFRLFWEGAINRSDLVDNFGVSVPQASKDISRYEEMAPGNITYDKRGKRYIRAEGFKPVLQEPSADRYLVELQNEATKDSLAFDSWLSSAPPVEFMPVPHRSVSVEILRAALDAIAHKRSMEIFYQSMNPNRAEPTWRWISPHAFANDGFRWHIRAYCHIDDMFKDFLLSRVMDVRGTDDPKEFGDNDRYWNERLNVFLIPNPALAETQQRVIATDYGMKDGRVQIPIRKALLYYFKKRLRLDVAEALDRPREAPVTVENMDEFNAALNESSA